MEDNFLDMLLNEDMQLACDLLRIINDSEKGLGQDCRFQDTGISLGPFTKSLARRLAFLYFEPPSFDESISDPSLAL